MPHLNHGLNNQFFQILIIMGFNALIAYIVENSGIFFVNNRLVLGYEISLLAIFLILLFVTYGLIRMKLLYKYSVASMLLLAGAWSNYFERITRGSVLDYIPFFDGYINLADVMVWTGLIVLLTQVWFLDGVNTPMKENKIVNNQT